MVCSSRIILQLKEPDPGIITALFKKLDSNDMFVKHRPGLSHFIFSLRVLFVSQIFLFFFFFFFFLFLLLLTKHRTRTIKKKGGEKKKKEKKEKKEAVYYEARIPILVNPSC